MPLKLLHKQTTVPPSKPADPPVLTLEPPPPELRPYIDVNAAQATVDPPKNPKFDSTRNSQAANPDIDKESDIPKISGERTDIVKAQDVSKPPDNKVVLQPILPKPEPPSPEERPEEKPKAAQTTGDMSVGKPEPVPQSGQDKPERPRPRTVKEALARQETGLPGRKMKQVGGVKRRLEISAMDARATLFGAYQERLVAAIVQRWYDLLEERAYTMENGGKVVVNFSVHYDGTISGVAIAGNTTGAEVLGYVCVKAIEDPAPYESWPSDMRHEIARGVFDVQFTFLY